MYGYIYLIVNNVNGKTYVGKHKLYNKNWNEDGYMGSGGKRYQNAVKKYGIENFEKFLITWTSSEKDACEKEEFWIAHYKSLGKAEYNISKGGEGGWLEVPQQVRNKISKTLMRHSVSEETRRKQSNASKGKPHPHKGDPGRVVAKETREKISKTLTGKPSHNQTIETINKIRETISSYKWYNNGFINKRAKICPEGFVLGRLPNYKNRQHEGVEFIK